MDRRRCEGPGADGARLDVERTPKSAGVRSMEAKGRVEAPRRVHWVRVVVAACALLLLAEGGAFARCLRYQPAVVSLEGELVARSLPGAPNYRSIARGDRLETVYVLVLEKPICVKGDPSSALTKESHAGVEEVQLIVTPRTAKRLAGQRVRATGSLVDGQSKEHRTPVVLEIKGLRKASSD